MIASDAFTLIVKTWVTFGFTLVDAVTMAVQGPADGGMYVTESPVIVVPVLPEESDKLPQLELATDSGAGITAETVRIVGWDLETP